MTRRIIGIIGPLLVTLAILLALEGTLRLAGVPAHTAAGSEPLAALPLFKPATAPDGVPIMQRHDVPSVTFLRAKLANGFRVFVVGDSSAYGFPVGPEFAFPRFLQERLASAMPGRTVEVVNCALNAIASWHARQIVDEVTRYSPDVIILYVGNGDWITPGPEAVPAVTRMMSGLHLYQLAAVASQTWQRREGTTVDVERVFNPADPFRVARERARGVQTLTAGEREWIIARYVENLRVMIAAGRAAGARVLVGDQGQNLSDFPPGASRHRRGLSDEERARWREAMQQADARLRAGEYQAALESLQRADSIDDRPAILHFMRGKCFEALMDFAAARDEYQRASDLDEAPLGAPSRVSQEIKEVASQSGAQFVDVTGALARSSPHGLVGNAFFYDYIHPTLRGHATIARVFAVALGAPDSDDHVTDPAAVDAAHPEVRDWIYRANTLLYIMLGWYDRAQAEVDEAGQRYPKLLGLREGIEVVRVKEPARSWDDFPDALD